MKNFKGKAIYNPSGKAGEYSYWAVNFYNGCSAKCEYCYNRHGITAKVLGADVPTLKKCLKDEETAIMIFRKELDQNSTELKKHGLFFNFVSDPFLPETIVLNVAAIQYCLIKGIPVKVLTKQTWWLEEYLQGIERQLEFSPEIWNNRHLIAFGFTLTGHDELEPGAAPNMDRIRAMKVLNDEGFKTWASIEPIIDFESSYKMITEVCNHVDLLKIGLQSGKKYGSMDLRAFMRAIHWIAETYQFKIYWKDSLIESSFYSRKDLPDEFCVNRDFKLHEL